MLSWILVKNLHYCLETRISPDENSTQGALQKQIIKNQIWSLCEIIYILYIQGAKSQIYLLTYWTHISKNVTESMP